MLKNHLKIAWRNLTKNKVYFSINILGLSIALTVSFLMLLWVYDEYSMDKFHANNDFLYRVKRTVPLEENVLDVYRSIAYPMLDEAKKQIPEIVKYTPLGHSFEDDLEVDNLNYRAQGTFANADFFAIFSFPIIAGDISQLDKKPEAIAISKRLAHRIWGDNWSQQAIGNTIFIRDNAHFTVEAIYQDLPKSSSIQNDFYYSLKHFLTANAWTSQWTSNGMEGVFLLQKDATLATVNSKLEKLLHANINKENKESPFLQKFSDDYLYAQFDEKAQPSGGRIAYVRIFMIAAIFLLLISCINFVNLSTAYAIKRSGEIGVRKVIGAKKVEIIKQFFTETAVITFISFITASLFTSLLLSYINDLTDKKLDENLVQPVIWMGIMAVFIGTTLLSGAYPSLVISSFKPIKALQGKREEKKNTISFRKGLVVLQFGLTILLIVAAIIVKQQVRYINNKDLGIAKDHIIAIHQGNALTEKYDVLRNELIAKEGIEDVTLAGPSPLEITSSSSGIIWPGKKMEEENIEFSLLWTAHNFPEVFEIPLRYGNYYREGTMDTLNIVLNESAVKVMGIQDPIGKTIEVWGAKRSIIGVLTDFHNTSLHQPIQPSVFFLDSQDAGMMFIKLGAKQTKKGLASVDATFKSVLPETPLHYNFIDQTYAANYKSESLTGLLTSYFAFISILISSLGLFGLATFMAKQRTKEIGIRKVLGASVANITTLISKDFLTLVFWAILIALPISYYLVNHWLASFTYKIQIQWWVFALAGAFALCIAFFTVGFQSIKSAITNPVKSLRTE